MVKKIKKFNAISIQQLFYSSQLDIIDSLNSHLTDRIENDFEKEVLDVKKGFTKSEQKEIDAFRNFLDYKKRKKKRQNTFSFKSKKLQQIDISKKFIPLFTRTPQYKEFIRKMALIKLVSDFENFLKKVIKACYKKQIKCLNNSERSMFIKDIINFSNIDDLKNQIIDSETTKLFYKDIEEINKYLKLKFNLDLSKNRNWNKFKEIYYGRNILVHNNGIVNDIYRSKVKNVKIKYLSVNKTYLEKSISIFKSISKSITKQLENKIFKEK